MKMTWKDIIKITTKKPSENGILTHYFENRKVKETELLDSKI